LLSRGKLVNWGWSFSFSLSLFFVCFGASFICARQSCTRMWDLGELERRGLVLDLRLVKVPLILWSLCAVTMLGRWVDSGLMAQSFLQKIWFLLLFGESIQVAVQKVEQILLVVDEFFFLWELVVDEIKWSI
jgi:hypothetical protein